MLGKFSKLFGIRPKKFLGVDIGSSSVRLVEISRKGELYNLDNYGDIGLEHFNSKPFRSFKKNSVDLSKKEIAENILKIVKEAEIETKDVCFSIPDFGSFFTSITLPIMDEDEIPQAVKYQARPYIPLSLEDVVLDWSVIEGETSKTELKILVVAIPNDVINHYRGVAELAMLNLKFLEPEVFSLARSITRTGENKGVVGLIEMGATSTTCSVLENDIVKISHSFSIAGKELTEIISRSLNIDYAEAEEVKRREGLLPKDELKNSKGTRELLLPLIGSILEETKKAFRNFYVQEGKEVKKVVIAGGLSMMPGLKEFLAVEIKKPVVIADPFLGIQASATLTNTLKNIGPYYGVAIGLALKGLE
ncbi:type IV pilus assembly protein PilM [Patescibacteria group bacterium]|nr:type IV pilus assembly protein PilM [Patescibacteria group bacterium]